MSQAEKGFARRQSVEQVEEGDELAPKFGPDGLLPVVTGRHISRAIVRQPALRWPIDPDLADKIAGLPILALTRRAKYLQMMLPGASLLIHLGMSGSLRRENPDADWRLHDHWEIQLDDGWALRYHDPRRFGSLHYTEDPQPAQFLGLGPEPLEATFSGDWLYQLSRQRRTAVKAFIMDQKTVVGVGNIYASESLFLAGIHPARPAGRISRRRYDQLVDCIRGTLARAIEAGGTTLRDFLNSEGQPGYFAQTLQVYGRAGQACTRCGATLREQRIGQRNSFFCGSCQR